MKMNELIEKMKRFKVPVLASVVVLVVAVAAVCAFSLNKKKPTTQMPTVSEQIESLANKELTQTGIVAFDYTDAEGNTVRLEGKAVASENGIATIEVTDASGNKVVFQGKAGTDADGKLTVSDITVKEAGTLVKPDGTEIVVSDGATIESAEETEGNSNSDITVSEEVKKDVEAAKEEEKQISDARDEVSKIENEVADNRPNKPSEDRTEADKGTSAPADRPTQPAEEETDAPTDRPTQKPTEKPTNRPTVPPTEAPTQKPTERPTQAPTQPTEPATHAVTKYIYYHDYDGSVYYTNSVTYLAYADGTPVNAEDVVYDIYGHCYFPDDIPGKFMTYWMINTDGPINVSDAELYEKYYDMLLLDTINLINYPGDIHMYPGYLQN